MTPGDRRPIAARGSRPAQMLASWLVRRRASPNAISLAGMGCGLAAGLAFGGTGLLPGLARPLWLAGAVLVQARLLANLLDGMVAVGRNVASPLGELYNEVPDRVSDTAILLGLGCAAGGSVALGLAAALAAMATAYVRTTGRSAGAPSEFCGPMAKQHRMALVTGLAVWCALVPAAWGPELRGLGKLGQGLPALALWAIVALSIVTAARRLARTAQALRSKAVQSGAMQSGAVQSGAVRP